MKTKLISTALLFALFCALNSSVSEDRKNDRAEPDKPKVPLTQRTGHTDHSKAFTGEHVHQGAGTLYMQTLLGRDAITGLNFMHKGPLMPKSSIGDHFHLDSDEMFLILDGDCEFTFSRTGECGLAKLYLDRPRPGTTMNPGKSSLRLCRQLCIHSSYTPKIRSLFVS